MTKSQATAEVFLTAFKAMPKSQRAAVLAGMAKDKALRRDLIDMAVVAERRRESSRPFRSYLADRHRR